MEKQAWKVAVVGGIVAAAGLGGFAVAGADAERPTVDSVELNRATADASAVDSSMASPASTVTTVTAAPVPPPATVAPPVVSFGDSADDSPDVLVPPAPAAPAPAPTVDESVSVDDDDDDGVHDDDADDDGLDDD